MHQTPFLTQTFQWLFLAWLVLITAIVIIGMILAWRRYSKRERRLENEQSIKDLKDFNDDLERRN